MSKTFIFVVTLQKEKKQNPTFIRNRHLFPDITNRYLPEYPLNIL